MISMSSRPALCRSSKDFLFAGSEMTAEIVNLRRARKAKARIEREKEAEANRIAFGRTKAEKSATTAERERAEREIEGHRRDPAGE
jgi:hypothetical protein